MEVAASPTPKGLRFTVQDNGSETLKAEVSSDLGAPPVTIYWRGRVDLDRMISFFVENCPRNRVSLFGALVFSLNESSRLEWSDKLTYLQNKIPADARFVRLEHANQESFTHSVSSANFVIWSRIDLESIPPGQPAPDYIGVAGQVGWLEGRAEELATFITSTHIGHLNRRTALDSITRVLHDLAPS